MLEAISNQVFRYLLDLIALRSLICLASGILPALLGKRFLFSISVAIVSNEARLPGRFRRIIAIASCSLMVFLVLVINSFLYLVKIKTIASSLCNAINMKVQLKEMCRVENAHYSTMLNLIC